MQNKNKKSIYDIVRKDIADDIVDVLGTKSVDHLVNEWLNDFDEELYNIIGGTKSEAQIFDYIGKNYTDIQTRKMLFVRAFGLDSSLHNQPDGIEHTESRKLHPKQIQIKKPLLGYELKTALTTDLMTYKTQYRQTSEFLEEKYVNPQTYEKDINEDLMIVEFRHNEIHSIFTEYIIRRMENILGIDSYEENLDSIYISSENHTRPLYIEGDNLIGIISCRKRTHNTDQ